MNTNRTLPPIPPVTEAELHAFIDGQLPADRQREIHAYLATRLDEAQRVESYRAHKRELQALFDPVLDEQAPQRLLAAARQPTAALTPWYLQRLAAGLAIAVVSGATGWSLRGEMPAGGDAVRAQASAVSGFTQVSAGGFAQRAAVAHAVYSPDLRRPVEVDAAHEDQLVAWLSKRMGAPMKPPHLHAQGYSLEGGRLLPGGQGPVAQFMYRNELGSKLTLYVSNDAADLGSATGPGEALKHGPESAGTAFRFAREGTVNVFYWVDGPFGYALSSDADRSVLAQVSTEVYRQLSPPR
ncbi:anti-sigma factor [Paucibacter sp. PLA-PC-4]|uniref:anti-sigma factor family protein n=1 Tax=Paucibacter sp. PLA-PC-4 TaxID=2993655 RepID=UPI00224AA6B6|nr:anti-sigma factor [Paucibacter sp. PLA-PC-4]MCX2865603.1 anti-sigma factor [Paucibacter sp. PLA-PC-4]